jgi:hypothetical protein
MKNLYLSILILIFGAKTLYAQTAQPVKNLAKYCEIVSVPYSVPDDDKQHFVDISFRFGWNAKAPSSIAVQFVNHGYTGIKFKFAIEDVTTKKMIILDSAHNSRFGSETLRANSESAIWSGPVTDTKDSFSLHVWDSDGDEFDKVPISISDQQ